MLARVVRQALRLADRVGLRVVLALAAVLYLWNLTVSGYANTYYAMAAQAASQDWGAFFFGSLDAANFITLDKPPAAIWLMALSFRLFGLGSWSILLPQALLGSPRSGSCSSRCAGHSGPRPPSSRACRWPSPPRPA